MMTATPNPALRAIAAGLLVASSVLALNAAGAATLEATAKISDVTLYPDAAIIKRQVTLDLPAGESEIQLADLPPSLDPASLRVEGSAGEKVTIGNVEFRLRANVPEADKTETQRKVKALRAERDRITDKIDSAENRKAMIQRLAQGGEAKENKLDLDQWEKAVEIVGRNLQAVNDELRGLKLEIERIDAEIAALEPPQIAGRPPAAREAKRIATIAIDAAGPTKLTLAISYRVNNAGWRPIYDARLDTRGASPSLEITRRAMIRQNSGEDWNEAKIALSTLSVNRGTAAPELRGERIAFYERPMPRGVPMAGAPAPMAAAEAMREQADMMSKQRVAAAPPPERRAEEQSAEIDASAYQT